jgi:hypothetical protein
MGKTKSFAKVYLAFTHEQFSDEDWGIVSDEPTISRPSQNID